MPKKVLGKGLEALITDISAGEGEQVVRLELDELTPNRYQPRHEFDAEKLEELTESIREHGVIQPIIVRRIDNKYEIIAGERRWRAARMAGLANIPAVVREVDDQKLMEIALVENLQRENLNPLEEAVAYQKLQTTLGLTQEALAQRVGKSRPQVANTLRLLVLPESVKAKLSSNVITAGHAKALLGLASSEEQVKMAERIVQEGLSVRQVESAVSNVATPQPNVPRGTKTRERTPDYIVELEDTLKRHLGTLVRIQPGRKQGKIMIDYYGDEDLERLLGILVKTEEPVTTGNAGGKHPFTV